MFLANAARARNALVWNIWCPGVSQLYPMYTARTQRNRRPGPGLDMLLAPAASLMVMLTIFIYSGVKDPRYEYCYCGCGSKTKLSTVPRLAGPDPVLRAPVIEVEPGLVTVDGTEVFNASDTRGDDFLVHDEAAGKLRHELEYKRSAWKRYHPERTFVGRVILKANRDTSINVLFPYLVKIRAAGYHRVLLYLRALDSTGLFVRARHSGAEAIMVPEFSEGEPQRTIHVQRFKTYDELAGVIVRQRNAGVPVRLSLFDMEAGIKRQVPLVWHAGDRISPFRLGEPDPDAIGRTRIRRRR